MQDDIILVVAQLFPMLVALFVARYVLRASRGTIVQPIVGVVVGVFVALCARGAAERLSGVAGVPTHLLLTLQLVAVALAGLSVVEVWARSLRRSRLTPI